MSGAALFLCDGEILSQVEVAVTAAQWKGGLK
jgi:hypothetical protein